MSFLNRLFSSEKDNLQSVTFDDTPSPIVLQPPTKLLAQSLGLTKNDLELLQLEHYATGPARRSTILFTPGEKIDFYKQSPLSYEERARMKQQERNERAQDTIEENDLEEEVETSAPNTISQNKSAPQTNGAPAPGGKILELEYETLPDSLPATDMGRQPRTESTINFFDSLTPQQQRRIPRQSQFILSCWNNYPLQHLEDLMQYGDIKANLPLSGGQTALVYAAERGNTDIVKFLVEKCGASPRYVQNSPAIIYAASRGWEDIVQYLLEVKDKGVDINTALMVDGRTLLMESLLTNNQHVLSLLMDYHDRGVYTLDFTAVDNMDRHALYYAIMSGQLSLVHLMVERTAAIFPVDQPNANGHSCLRYATQLRAYDIVAFLLSLGCDPQRMDPNTGTRPMDVAMVMKDNLLLTLFEYGTAAMAYYHNSIARDREERHIEQYREQMENEDRNLDVSLSPEAFPVKQRGQKDSFNSISTQSRSDSLQIPSTTRDTGANCPATPTDPHHNKDNNSPSNTNSNPQQQQQQLPQQNDRDSFNSSLLGQRSPSFSTNQRSSGGQRQSLLISNSNNNFHTLRIQRPAAHPTPSSSSSSFQPVQPLNHHNVQLTTPPPTTTTPTHNNHMGVTNNNHIIEDTAFDPLANPLTKTRSNSHIAGSNTPRYLVYHNNDEFANATIISLNKPSPMQNTVQFHGMSPPPLGLDVSQSSVGGDDYHHNNNNNNYESASPCNSQSSAKFKFNSQRPLPNIPRQSSTSVERPVLEQKPDLLAAQSVNNLRRSSHARRPFTPHEIEDTGLPTIHHLTSPLNPMTRSAAGSSASIAPLLTDALPDFHSYTNDHANNNNNTSQFSLSNHNRPTPTPTPTGDGPKLPSRPVFIRRESSLAPSQRERQRDTSLNPARPRRPDQSLPRGASNESSNNTNNNNNTTTTPSTTPNTLNSSNNNNNNSNGLTNHRINIHTASGSTAPQSHEPQYEGGGRGRNNVVYDLSAPPPTVPPRPRSLSAGGRSVSSVRRAAPLPPTALAPKIVEGDDESEGK